MLHPSGSYAQADNLAKLAQVSIVSTEGSHLDEDLTSLREMPEECSEILTAVEAQWPSQHKRRKQIG